jgi:hypothetical protein
MTTLMEIEEALGTLPPADRSAAAGPVLADLAFDTLSWDEDDVNAAARRGLLLAAAEGDPSSSAGAGSRAALETAADLAASGYGDAIRRALTALAEGLPSDTPLLRAAVAELVADERSALEAFAVVVLHRALD